MPERAREVAGGVGIHVCWKAEMSSGPFVVVVDGILHPPSLQTFCPACMSRAGQTIVRDFSKRMVGWGAPVTPHQTGKVCYQGFRFSASRCSFACPHDTRFDVEKKSKLFSRFFASFTWLTVSCCSRGPREQQKLTKLGSISETCILIVDCFAFWVSTIYRYPTPTRCVGRTPNFCLV